MPSLAHLQFTPPDAPTPKFDIYAHRGRHLISHYIEALRAKMSGNGRIFIDKVTVPKHHDGTVAIVGAGVAGLYSAMMLRDMGIPFKIFEASDRVGGRLFTKEFSTAPNDYFDVGAMRFPDINIMKRLFHLFGILGICGPDGILKEYIFKSPNNRFLFNGHNFRRSEVRDDEDQFEAWRIGVDPDFINVPALKDDAINSFMTALKDDPPTLSISKAWRQLMRFDDLSARAFLSTCKRLPTPAINWMETRDVSTGALDGAFSEWVLESMAFGDAEDDPDKVNWYLLQGGAQRLADKMTEHLGEVELSFEAPATGFKAVRSSDEAPVTAVEVSFGGEKPSKAAFDHVISTLPLPVVLTLDIDDAGMDVAQHYALRTLKYGPACKIGIKFKTQWWSEGELKIRGGQSMTDRPSRVVVYPSYGIDPQDPNPSHVMIASYTWTTDALRLSALIAANDKEALKAAVLRDLAAIHLVSYDMLLAQYVDMFAWDWNADPYSQGAYASFGPGDFQAVYTNLTQPAAGGRLHFAGEALSVRHAWAVGALHSAWRAVHEILTLSYPDLLGRFKEKWGQDPEWVPGPECPNIKLETESVPGQGVYDLLDLHLNFHIMSHKNEFEVVN